MTVSASARLSARWIAFAYWLVGAVIGLLTIVFASCLFFLFVGGGSLSSAYSGVEVGSEGVSVGFESDRASAFTESASAEFAPTSEIERVMLNRQFGKEAHVAADSVPIVITPKSSSATLWAVAIAALVVGWVFLLTFLVLLRRMLGRANAGEPFSQVNIRALRLMALVVFVGSLAFSMLKCVAIGLAIESAGGVAEAEFGYALGWLPISLLLLVLAEVWRYGVALQEDAKATV